MNSSRGNSTPHTNSSSISSSSSSSRGAAAWSQIRLVIAVLFGFVLAKFTDVLWLNSISSGDLSTSLTFLATPYQQNVPKQDHEDGDNAISQTPMTPGWSTIHVFFGDASALTAEDPQRKWYAQVKQDEIIVDLLELDQRHHSTNGNNNNNLFFIDLAANDAKEFSNTLALERHHGWNGLCIEPNAVYWYGLSHRKCITVGALVGDTVQPVQVKFRGVFGGIVGRMDEKLANRKREPDSQVETRYTVPFAQILLQFKAPKMIDYMSLDVEGAEYLVMNSFPFEDYTIRLLTIERPTRQLKTLLESHGYLFLKDLAWWGETLWAHESTGWTPTHPKIVKIQTEERN